MKAFTFGKPAAAPGAVQPAPAFGAKFGAQPAGVQPGALPQNALKPVESASFTQAVEQAPVATQDLCKQIFGCVVDNQKQSAAIQEKAARIPLQQSQIEAGIVQLMNNLNRQKVEQLGFGLQLQQILSDHKQQKLQISQKQDTKPLQQKLIAESISELEKLRKEGVSATVQPKNVSHVLQAQVQAVKRIETLL